MASPTGIKPGNNPTGGTGNKIPKGYSQGQIQQFTPEQMQLFSQMFSQVSPDSYTSRLAGGDESLFQEMEAPAMKQFSELQGGLASRFSGMGSGARRSSGFQNASNQASSDFAQSLQSRRQELQRNAIQDLMGMSNNLLGQRPYENFMVEKQQNPWVDIAGKFAGAIPGAVASYMNPLSGAGNTINSAGGGSLMSSYNSNRGGNQTSGQFGLPTFMGR